MRLKIITPDKIILDIETKGVFVRAIDGELGVLPGHIPLMTALDIGTASFITSDDNREYVSIIGGIFKVENDEVSILTENAELGEDIDITRANLAADKARAELEGLLEKGIDKHSPDMDRARLALLRALSRINAGDKAKTRK
jgi:F-type H+-transporting ATPase subunit epsilon